MFGSKSPREAAEHEIRALFEDLHGIKDPKEKERMIQDFLWKMLAPLHDLHNASDLDRAMEKLWAATLVKSIFGLKEVNNRLREFTRQKNALLRTMSAEGIGLMAYLLTPDPDTFGRLIEEATAKINHGLHRRGYTRVTILEQEYSILFYDPTQTPVAS